MIESPKLLVTRRWPQAIENYLSEHFDVVLNSGDVPLSRDALSEALARYDIILPTITDRFDANMLLRPNIRTKLLCNYGAGTNHIDLEACRAAGIAVSNTPDILTQATAELALALILAVARRLGEGEREVRSSQWTGWRPSHMLGTKVTGATLGIVGFGRIGQETARMAHRGFDMPILYHARSRAADEIERPLGASFRPALADLLAESDFVSLHIPGGSGNDGMIGAEQFAQMKPSAFLINTARGTIVDEGPLVEALASGSIAGAGLDVFAQEPAIPESLMRLQNVVLAPHLGSATRQTREEMGARAVANLELFLAGRPLRDPV